MTANRFSRFFSTFRTLGVVLGVVAFTLLLTSRVYAQAADTTGSATADVAGVTLTKAKIVDAINAPTPNLANTTAYIYYTITVLMNGTFDGCLANKECRDSGSPTPTTGYARPESVQAALQQRGAFGGLAFMISEMVVHPPASSQVYFADLWQNSRFVAKPAYAQGFGIGFGALSPILGTWKAFRDIAYYLIALLFIITGFLILTRQKLSGNVAVTVQQALPRLVITLILITFSYAIAGLIIDFMFLALAFIANLFTSRIFEPSATFFDDVNPSKLAFDTHFFKFFLSFVFASGDASAWNTAQALGDMIYNTLNSVTSGTGLGPLIPDPGSNLGDLFSGILNVVFTLIFAIALFIAMMRTFFQLIMSYAGFVINVVLGPIILLQNAIPGKNSFSSWIKNLLAGIMPFVVVVFMLLMSLALTGAHTQQGIGYDGEGIKNGNSIVGLRLPLIMVGDSALDASTFIGILGMGFMLLLPEAVKMTKEFFGASGGPFEKYKEAAVNNFKKGWTGDKYVPSAKGILGGGLRATAGSAVGTAGGAIAARRGLLGSQYQTTGGQIKAAMAGGVGGAIIGGMGFNRALNIAKWPISKADSVRRNVDAALDMKSAAQEAYAAYRGPSTLIQAGMTGINYFNQLNRQRYIQPQNLGPQPQQSPQPSPQPQQPNGPII